jgi:methyl-accepting chemotaxis protein
MSLKNLTIKYKIYSILLVSILSLGFTIIYSESTISSIIYLKDTKELTSTASLEIVKIKGSTSNIVNTLDVKYYETFKKDYSKLKANINKLNSRLSNQKFEYNLNDSIDKLNNFNNSVDQVIKSIKKIGVSTNDGLRLELINSVKKAEQFINDADDYEVLAMMLLIRKSEKDFMLTLDKKYINELDKNYKNMLSSINSPLSNLDDIQKKIVIKNINLYLESFKKLSDEYIKLGLDNNNGYKKDMISISNSIKKDFDTLYNKLLISIEDRIAYKKMEALIVFLSIILILISIVLLVTKNIHNSLSYLISKVINNEKDIDHSATELSNASELLSTSTQQQSSSIDEISANIDNSMNKLHNITNDIKEIDIISDETIKFLEKEKSNTTELVQKMSNINESSKNIANIVKTIDELAFQTNLLSLNAAVEAARAGEHGTGFAVVAEEVRTLANKSSVSASDTTEIISNILREINDANSITKITNESFFVLNKRVSNIDNLLDNTKNSIEEQNISMIHITESINTISQSVDEIASSAEELSSSANFLDKSITELTEYSIQVKKIIG